MPYFGSKPASTILSGANIADDSITSAKVVDGVIVAADLAANSVDSSELVDGSIDTSHIGALQVTTAKIAADAIDGTKLADDAVDSEHYTDGSIDNVHLADDAVDSDEIASGAIDNDHMAANSVDSDQYVDGSIDNAHLAANSVDSDQYVDGSIDNVHLADDAVDSDELAAGAVDIAHLSATGTAGSGNYLRGDNSWASISTSGAYDLNGGELVLDADGNTSITADTDNTIDIKIAGADDFQFTANTMSVLSGSTLNIDSGATIANSGTATGFGGTTLDAISGIIETDGTYVDSVIFGPTVDNYDWDERTAASASKLMLATIKDAGADTTVEIWDLTDPDVVGGSTLGSVTISGAATPTSVDACMGYIIVGHEDGYSIVDPHDGSWTLRTIGHPKGLSTSSTPALGSNNTAGVTAFIHQDATRDERTGGPMPVFVAVSDSITNAVMYSDGQAGNHEVTGDKTAGHKGKVAVAHSTAHQIRWVVSPGKMTRKNIQNDSIAVATGATEGLHVIANEAHNGLAIGEETLVTGQDSGLNMINMLGNQYAGSSPMPSIANINRTYNSGFMHGEIAAAWLANSVTADRSFKANTLTQNGTVVEAAVESGAELKGYNDFSGSNYLTQAFDDDFDFGTDSFSLSIWAKANGTSTGEYAMFGRRSASHFFYLQFRGNDSDKFRFEVADGSTNLRVSSSGGNDDNTWHHIVAVFDSSGATDEGRIYRDGVLEGTTVASMNTMTDPDGVISIGAWTDGSLSCVGITLALARISATVPNAAQIRAMYEAEKGMFAANAKCLLQSGSTDAVLDVDVDKITGKVAVTQTDSVQIWDGLVVESEPTIATGGSTWEHNKLFGGKRVEINDANLFYTAPEEKLREVAEVVRGLGSKLPKGVDMSKAKAWIFFDGSTSTVEASYNIESVSGTANATVTFGIPFKTSSYVILGMTQDDYILMFENGSSTRFSANIRCRRYTTQTLTAKPFRVAFFGELESE